MLVCLRSLHRPGITSRVSLRRVSAFAGLDACVTPVLTIPDLSSDAHAAARKLFIPDNDGTRLQLGCLQLQLLIIVVF